MTSLQATLAAPLAPCTNEEGIALAVADALLIRQEAAVVAWLGEDAQVEAAERVLDDWLCEFITRNQTTSVPADWLADRAYIERFAAAMARAALGALTPT